MGHRTEEFKNPFYTFLTKDNYYSSTTDIDPQLLNESLKSFTSIAKDTSQALKREQRRRRQQLKQFYYTLASTGQLASNAPSLTSLKHQQQELHQRQYAAVVAAAAAADAAAGVDFSKR